jgi:DNA (cytosine-5)-methyltransferase 1
MRRPKAFDLFCGAGGLTLGLKRAGFWVAGALDVDHLAVETYRLNHPTTPVWETDIRKLSAQRVLRALRLKPGSLALLAGCPPCQAFSSLRTLNGRKRVRDRDTKDLLFQFLRFARVLRPKAILLENVPGLANDARLKRFRAALHRMGYETDFDVINAAHYGVPQRRRRLIFVASRVSAVSLARRAKKKATVRTVLEGLPAAGTSGDALHDVEEARSKKVTRIIARIPKDGGSRADLGSRDQLKCHKKCKGFFDIYGRMAWDEVSPTITSGCVNPSKGRFLHPSEDRCITLREAALLQTFPKRYRFSLERGKFEAARMIGNALPPELVKRQASVLYRSLRRPA